LLPTEQLTATPGDHLRHLASRNKRSTCLFAKKKRSTQNLATWSLGQASHQALGFLWFLFPLQIPPKIRSTWSQGTSLSATLSGPNQSLGLVAMSGPPRQMESAHNLGFCPEMDGEIESCYVLIISDNYLAIISCHFYNLLGSI